MTSPSSNSVNRRPSEIDTEDSFNDSVHLDDSWFYGPPKKRQALSHDGKENSLSPKMGRTWRASLVEKSLGELEIFPKQRLALAKLDDMSKSFRNTRIFSFEMPGHSDGERRYVVTTLERFWTWYNSLNERHLYELIPESSPCRLYFDLEFSKKTNSDISHENVYKHFMDTVESLLKSEFDLDVDPVEEFLVLDSSTEDKFSAHVICHLPNGVLFPSNTAIRPFSVKLAEALLEDAPAKIWNSDGTKETFLFDSAVYTKNRNLRLFMSSKLGKSSVLKLADYCSFYGSKKPTEQEIFYDSLCVPANVHKFPLLDIPESVLRDANACWYSKGGSTMQTCEGSGPSPYPQLDEFMLMVWRKWSQSVYIRQWKLITDGEEERHTGIVYYPANCRYCFNIGREHKSNGTYWTVNFERNDFYQKCFDPECRGVSSNRFPLPSFMANSLRKSMCGGSAMAPDGPGSSLDEDDVASFFDESYTEMNEFFTKWDDIFEQ